MIAAHQIHLDTAMSKITTAALGTAFILVVSTAAAAATSFVTAWINGTDLGIHAAFALGTLFGILAVSVGAKVIKED